MKKYFPLIALFCGSLAMADVCTTQEAQNVRQALQNIQSSGFAEVFASQNIGYGIGECVPYSLELLAGRPAPMHAPAPTCGIVLILAEEYSASQAAWILDIVGSSYRAPNGVRVPLCAEVNPGFGPMPGTTVHN